METDAVREIADLDLLLPTSIVALVIEAASEIARFDGEAGLGIVPFEAVLPRIEAAASVKLEELSAVAKSAAPAEVNDGGKRNPTGNARAMNAAIEDLVRFMDRDDVPVLCHAAVAHAQFETIHPFGDGNGRTGRALVHAMLRGKGLTKNITVPVSAGLLTHPDRYFEALTAYRAGDIEPIARSFAESSFRAIANGRELVEELRAIRAEWQEKLRLRRDSAGHRILDVLARQPVMDAAFAQRELDISASAARRAFAELEGVGIVTEFSGMKRNRCWRSDEVLLALDSFAGKAGRRGRPA
ncbi:Fic family protein [Saccharopolyspora flava]|uniref:Fic/DOC family protein n=1 Tax=Saccharopolyspora flava TaxID=95161 RepID=A0A1I6REZ9_9PSEU|nr:Fic family protein [Saccharopolyspora flava]SFS63058.1 Fic/DOC family protein [Saccharopolyspora flava]